MTNQKLKNKSKDILKMISSEFQKEKSTISLIPSENSMSGLAASMYASKSNSRYLLPLKIGAKYFMPGRENLEHIIEVLEQKLCSIYKNKYVITKGLSGLHQMDIIISALSKKTDKIVIIDALNGGHSKTIGVAKKYGFDVEKIDIEFKDWDIDYKKLKVIVHKWKKEKVLIYIDHTIVLNPLNVNKLIKAVPPHWIIYYDISHLQLFYFTHTFNFPKYGNFFFGGSTHKTFPGPQKAIISLDNEELYELVNNEFYKTISSVHTGSLLALLITVIEMEKFGVAYAKDIIVKTRYFAKCLSKKLNVLGPQPFLTNTHQVWIDVSDALRVTQKLASVGIITYPTRIPSTKRNGLRFGIQELCRFGIKNKDLEILAEVIISCVIDDQTDKNLKIKIKNIAKKLTTIQYTIKSK